jgi:hypothetical protein
MIVASVCTIPGRSSSLLAVLTDLLKQSMLPDLLLVSASEYYPRGKKYLQDEELSRIKEFLEDYPIPSQVVFTTLDEGPCRKLLTPLNHPLVKRNDLILILDDDALLASRAIESLFNAYMKSGKAVYCVMGGRSGRFMHQERIPENFDYFVVDIAGGYRGVLYNAEMFEKDFEIYLREMMNAHKRMNMIAMSDDHIFSYYFKMKGIERRVAKPMQLSTELDYHSVPNTDGIMQDPDAGVSMEIIRKYFEERSMNWVISDAH